LIAKCVDGTGFMSNRNLLVNREDTHVQIVESNGTTVANVGTPQMDEVIPIDKCPSTTMA